MINFRSTFVCPQTTDNWLTERRLSYMALWRYGDMAMRCGFSKAIISVASGRICSGRGWPGVDTWPRWAREMLNHTTRETAPHKVAPEQGQYKRRASNVELGGISPARAVSPSNCSLAPNGQHKEGAGSDGNGIRLFLTLRLGQTASIPLSNPILHPVLMV